MKILVPGQIKAARAILGWSQEALAETAGLSEDAKNFYKNAGFRESPVHPMLLMVGLGG